MIVMETKSPARPWGALIGALVLVALIAVWAAQGVLAGTGVPIGRAATIAVGMTLQAIPFLLLGVFVAELIEAFVSPSRIPDKPGCLRVCRPRRGIPPAGVRLLGGAYFPFAATQGCAAVGCNDPHAGVPCN